MSLVSTKALIGSIKEYVYRGFQQLPLVVGSTSLLFTIATGSIAHANIVLGMGILMPLYTVILQNVLAWSMNYLFPGSIFWKRATGDTCKIIPDYKKTATLEFFANTTDGVVPSYWLTSMAFFIGYSISNAVDSLQTPAAPGSNEINYQQRNTHATIVIVILSIFTIFIFSIRFIFTSGCEGLGYGGIILSILTASGAAGLGNLVYKISRACGARSSDLFGILSQILPSSSTSPMPVVCTAE